MLFAHIARVIKPLATLITKEIILIQGHDVSDKHVLSHPPVLNELNKCHLPPVAESPGQEPYAPARLALALPRINNNHRLFSLVILKRHSGQYRASNSFWQPRYHG